ncbi:MAG TPA: hypothetical protein VFG10_14165 [Saprospiraceae bacterium]|nr:hypothetical protein [Saprospiraceae bacterium]
MSKSIEIWKIYIERRERYVYFLVGISIALIGYSVHLTIGSTFKPEQLILLSAIISWGISTYNGMRYNEKGANANKIDYFGVLAEEGGNPVLANDPILIKMFVDAIKKKVDGKKKGQTQNYKNMVYWFYGGLVLFIAWHLVSMTIATIQ